MQRQECVKEKFHESGCSLLTLQLIAMVFLGVILLRSGEPQIVLDSLYGQFRH